MQHYSRHVAFIIMLSETTSLSSLIKSAVIHDADKLSLRGTTLLSGFVSFSQVFSEKE